MSVTLYIREECRYEVTAETAVEAARLFMATPNKFLTSVDERDWDPSEDVDYNAVEAVFMGEDVDG